MTKVVHTRKLLAQLHELRAREVIFLKHVLRDLEDGDPPDPAVEDGLETISDRIRVIKDELATREHIPNKAEARKNRQAKALAGRRLPKHHPRAREGAARPL